MLAVPEAGGERAIEAWLDERRAFLRARPASDEWAAAIEPMALAPTGPLGRLGNPPWRAFVMGTLLADHACYEAPVDQVDLARLLYVMHAFPRGFRLWGADAPGLGWVPVGYTGWYPIARATFEALEQRSDTLQSRLVAPLADDSPNGGFVYVFNFSIVRALRGTIASKRLVEGLAQDLAGAPRAGLAAITVSDEGARVVARFGMKRTGTLVVDGCEEGVFTSRAPG